MSSAFLPRGMIQSAQRANLRESTSGRLKQLEVLGQSFVKEGHVEKRGSRNQHMNSLKSLLRTRLSKKPL